MNVIHGANGAGKSSVLDFLATLFSCSRYFAGEDERRFPMGAHNIRNESECLTGKLTCHTLNTDVTCEIMYSGQEIRASMTPSERHYIEEHIKKIQAGDLTLSFPIVVYYPTNRAMLDIPERIRGFRPVANQLDALDGALLNSLDFRSFIARLRESEQGARAETPVLKQFEVFSAWYAAQRNAVQKAIGEIVTGFSSLHVDRPLRITIEKYGMALELTQLSDGEKCLIALVGDLAQRLAIANPALANPLEGEGVVLIDEIDLHLHPQWQRDILDKLMKTFPNCQFIITTHSPQILGETKKEYLICLESTGDGIVLRPTQDETFGMTSNMILQTQMESSPRNRKVEDLLKEAFREVEWNHLNKAREIKTRLENIAPDIPELLRLDMQISMKEITGK